MMNDIQTIKKIITMDSTNKLNVGDQLLIDISGYGEKTLTVQKVTGDTVIAMFDDILECRLMNSKATNEGGFEKSDLNQWLQTEFKNKLPANIKNQLKELTIPSYGDIFGHDEFYNDYFEPDNSDERFPLMENRKNRMALFNNELEWYWMKNAMKKERSSTYFALVYFLGSANIHYATSSLGVRPVLYLVR